MNIQVFQILTVNIFILLLITLIIFLKMLMLYNSSVHLISQIIKTFLKKDSVFCCLFIFFIFCGHHAVCRISVPRAATESGPWQ